MAKDDDLDSERLRKLKQQQEKIKKQMALEKSRLRDKLRAEDTRRKILDGALMQKYALDHPEISALMEKLRKEKLTRADDRALFGLAPLPKNDNEKQSEAVAAE